MSTGSPRRSMVPAGDAPLGHGEPQDSTQARRPTLADINDSVYQTMARAHAQLAAVESQPSVPSSQREVDSGSHWELDPDQIMIGERIAVGGFAEVFVGKYQGTIVAIKLLLHVDETALERFRREVAILAALRHPNLLLFMGYATSPSLAMVSEYMHRGSLFKILRKREGRPLDPKLQRAVARSVARGMAHLHTHSPPILHLDLKSPNILVDAHWRIKIADFGLARLLRSGRKSVTPGVESGTPEWMAPEVLRTEGFDTAADVYSYGVVLWETLTGKAPWEHMHPMQVVGAVGFQRKQLPRPTSGDKFLVGLAMRCLAAEPQARPSFEQILEELETEYTPSKPEVLSLSAIGSQHGLALPSSALSAAPSKPCQSGGGGTTKSSPDRNRADSAEDDRSTPRVSMSEAAELQKPPASLKSMLRGVEDSAMQLSAGQTSETERSGSSGSEHGRASSAPSPAALDDAQWTPLRQKRMSAMPAALPPPSPKRSGAPAATEDSMQANASHMLGGDAGHAGGRSPPGTSPKSSAAEQPASPAAGRSAASASGPEVDAAAATQEQSAGSPQTPVAAGKTPFEMAAFDSPFSTPSPVQPVRSTGAAASPLAPSPAQQREVAAASRQHPKAAAKQPVSHGTGGPGSAPAACTSPFQRTAQKAAAGAQAAGLQEPPAAQAKATAQLSTASAPAAYKSPFEAAAELQPAFSLAPSQGTTTNSVRASAAAASGSDAPAEHGDAGAVPAASQTAGSHASMTLSSAGSGAAVDDPQPRPSAASSAWSSAQGSHGSVSSAGSTLSKGQLRERLAMLKAAQLERLKSTSHCSVDRLSSVSPADRTDSTANSDSVNATSRRAGSSSSTQGSGGGSGRPSLGPSSIPDIGRALHAPDSPSGVVRSADDCAAAPAAAATFRTRSSSEARRSHASKALNVIREESPESARSHKSLLDRDLPASDGPPSFAKAPPALSGASSEALLAGVRALQMDVAPSQHGPLS